MEFIQLSDDELKQYSKLYASANQYSNNYIESHQAQSVFYAFVETEVNTFSRA